jgi:hypothetical protein
MVAQKESGAKPKKRGRPPGSKNKKPPSLKRAIGFIVRRSLKNIPPEFLFEGDAYDLFQVIYKDMRQPGDLRIEAATRVIRHERPMLQSSTVQHSGTLTLESLVTEAIKNPPSE